MTSPKKARSILFCPVPVASDLLLKALREAAGTRTVYCWPEIEAKDEVCCLVTFNPPVGVFDGLTGLRLIHGTGAGVNAILAAPGRPKGVPVARVANVELGQAIAQFVIHAVVRETRDFRLYDDQQRERRWHRRPHRHASNISVGILGFGALGAAVASSLMPLGYKLRAWSRTRKHVAGIESFAGREELSSFLEGCDVMVVLLPDTPETRNLVSEDVIYRLPRGAVLIAAGRGGQVDESALIKALDEGYLVHSYLDVFEQEPLPRENMLWTHPGVILTPHIAGAPHPAAVARLVVENLERVDRGDAPLYVADEALGY